MLEHNGTHHKNFYSLDSSFPRNIDVYILCEWFFVIIDRLSSSSRKFVRLVVRTRTETPLHLTDGHVWSVPGYPGENIGGKLSRIPFMATGGPPEEQPEPPVEFENVWIEEFKLVTWYGLKAALDVVLEGESGLASK